MVKARLPRNYIPWNRDWVVIRRHLPVVLKPAFLGLVMVAFWRFVLVPLRYHFRPDAGQSLELIVFPLVGFIYVIFASVAVTSVFDQYKAVSKSVVKRDVDTFLLYRDEQLPIMMHILIGAPSVLLTLLLLFYTYLGDEVAGAIMIFAVTFMLSLIWVIATELDDFSKSIWFRERIPKEWYEIDIEEHFRIRSK